MRGDGAVAHGFVTPLPFCCLPRMLCFLRCFAIPRCFLILSFSSLRPGRGRVAV